MLAVLALAPAVLKGVANELFVSEYVEGSGHNKALEIFNGTGGAIDLGRYSLRIVRNGEGPFGGSFALSGLLAEGATLVVVGSRADDELKALGEVERGGAPMDFNGDDVLGLFREGALIDVVGEWGGVAWGVDMTLRRHPSVVGPASVFERGEWQEWPSDTFDDLGRHTMDEDDVAVSEPSNHVTGFSAHAGPPGAISLGWTDATGTVLPQGYVLQGWRETAPALPVDGERLVEDTDFSDGTGTLFPGYGEEAVTVRGLAPATTWHFRLVPHASGDAGVDYKTDGNVPSAVATTGLPTLSLRLEPTTVDESGDLNRSMATVTLSSAPSAYPLILSIHSSDTSEATAPATVSFDDAESGLSQSFFVMAVEDGLHDGEQSATLSVMADGFAAATAVLEVRDVDVPVSHPDALLFSEYVEGSAFNKAFELYNASDRAVALADYAVRLFRDRSEVAESSIELGGIAASLAPGDTLVIRHSQFTAYAGESTIWGSATFNGDDTLALFHRGVLVDLIGEIGPSELDLSEVTLRRRREVLAPSATFSLREWAEYPQNTFDDLGAHTLGLGEPSPEPSLHPSALRAAMDTDGTITLRWTDSSGETLPRAYLLQGWTGVPPSLPSDGMPPVIDEDLSDGRGVFEVGYGVESTKIELPVGPATTWQFRLVPFSNL
ncbi:MAG: lamin tail domain-containing protein, partial [Opitutales bacterium]